MKEQAGFLDSRSVTLPLYPSDVSRSSSNNFVTFIYKALEEPIRKTPEEKFRKVLIQTIVNWAEESQIETPKLVREMFR